MFIKIEILPLMSTTKRIYLSSQVMRGRYKTNGYAYNVQTCLNFFYAKSSFLSCNDKLEKCEGKNGIDFIEKVTSGNMFLC